MRRIRGAERLDIVGGGGGVAKWKGVGRATLQQCDAALESIAE